MTILTAFLVSVAGADPALVAKGDELNLHYVECLFSVSRAAQQQSVDESSFSKLLRGSCEQERSQLRHVLLAVMIQRGASPAQAEAEWMRVEAQGLASVERAYRVVRNGP